MQRSAGEEVLLNRGIIEAARGPNCPRRPGEGDGGRGSGRGNAVPKPRTWDGSCMDRLRGCSAGPASGWTRPYRPRRRG